VGCLADGLELRLGLERELEHLAEGH